MTVKYKKKILLVLLLTIELVQLLQKTYTIQLSLYIVNKTSYDFLMRVVQ